MIMILGSTNDDILYFENIIRDKKEEIILKKFRVVFGTIFNQSVVLVKDVHSNYVSSAITTYLIEKYFIVLVFVVGKCMAYSPNLKNGDIVISRAVITGDVDLTTSGTECQIWQIPNFKPIYDVSIDLIQSLELSFENRTFSRYFRCVFVSTNTKYVDTKQITDFEYNGRVFGVEDNLVFENELGGVAIACELYDVPYVSVKVVENVIGQKTTLDQYINVIKQYASVGKAVISSIGEIGRTDVVLGE